jgi:hypothetical protein
VSYLLLPHARRVASPLWVLDRRRLRRLHRCGVATGRAVTRAQERWSLRRAPCCVAPSRAEASPASAGRALRTRAVTRVAVGRARAVHMGQADAMSVGHAPQCNWAQREFSPVTLDLVFLISEYI